MSNFDWKNSLTKSPPSTYQITDIFSISGVSLLNNTVALKRAVKQLLSFQKFIISFKELNIKKCL